MKCPSYSRPTGRVENDRLVEPDRHEHLGLQGLQRLQRLPNREVVPLG